MSRTLKIELPCKRELNFHVFPVSAFNRDVWLNFECLGRLLGSTWTPTWALLGPTWRQLGRLRSQLGRFRGQVGTNLNPLWALLGALAALLSTLGRLQTLQGRSRIDFGAPKKDSGASERRFRRLRGSILESLVIFSSV